MGLLEVTDRIRNARRMFKKVVQRGRSERGGEAYSLPYVDPLNDARAKLADFFNILLERSLQARLGGRTFDDR